MLGLFNVRSKADINQLNLPHGSLHIELETVAFNLTIL